ncbi:TonB-dependent receptor plug domain-containing protein [Fibrobacterota bacterium]
MIFWAALWFMASTVIFSQTMDELLEMPLEELADIEVVTASKVPRQPSDITQKVDVVTRQQIDQTVSGNRNIAELIQYLPGASVKVLSRNYPNWGAYGGIGPKYSTYMVQGLPVDAFMDPMTIEAMAVERIEIQRGPASVLYPNYLSQDFAGNQSPLAGTVNLIIKDQVERPKSMVSLGYGSYNTYTGQGYHENRIKGLSLMSGASFEGSDYTDYGSTDSWLNIRKDPEYQKAKAFIGTNLYMDKAKKHKIALFGNQVVHWGDEGRENRGYDHLYSLLNIGYTGQLTSTLALAVKTGMRWYDRTWDGDNAQYALEETKGMEQMIVPVDLSLTYNHYNNSILTLGADYQRVSYVTWVMPINQSKDEVNNASASQIGAYLQEELQVYKFILRAGGRYNLNFYNLDKVEGNIPDEDDPFWQALLWSAGAKYHVSKEVIFFANGGNSFIPPGLKSTYGTLSPSDSLVQGMNGQLPNHDLDPERGTGLDLGFDYLLPVHICLSTRAFFTVIEDAIIENVISKNPSQSMSVNTDKIVGKGLEFSVRQQIEKKICWFVNTTYTHSEISAPQDPDQDRAEVPFVPDMMTNMGLTFYLPYGIVLSPWMHFGGRIYDSSFKSNRSSYESSELLNVNVSKTFALNENQGFDVFVKAYNLTDNRFDMPWQFRDPGFAVNAGTSMAF